MTPPARTIARIARRLIALAAPLLLAACAAPESVARFPASPPACALPAAAEGYPDFASLPQSVHRDLASRFADVPTTQSERAMAARDAPFGAGAFLDPPAPNRRFLQGLRVGGDVIVIYEHSGLLRHLHVVLYRSNAEGAAHAFANLVSHEESYCRTVERVIADPRDPVLWNSRIDW